MNKNTDDMVKRKTELCNNYDVKGFCKYGENVNKLL